MKVYDFTVNDTKRRPVTLKQFEGKVCLIVNTATACSLTPQYEGLEALYQKFKDQGFEILDFPSNQFKQAMGSDEDLANFCRLNYKTTFTTFGKVFVNGSNASPLFKHLRKESASRIMRHFIKARIKWNFTKFLVDQEGNVINRYDPEVKPRDIEADIKALLNKKESQL